MLKGGEMMGSYIIKPKIKIIQVSKNQCQKNPGANWTMRIGRYNEENEYRVFFNISIDEIPQDAKILGAKLFINIIDVESGYLNKLTPYQLIDDWSINTVTWCNQPGFSKDMSGQSVNISRKSQYIFDITTILQNWHKYKIPNYGIVLKTKEIYDSGFVTMSTGENESCGAKVEICYESKCHCETSSTKFISAVEEFNTNDFYSFSKLKNTSLTTTVMYFVENLGVNEITANLQVSPDGVNFIDEPAKISPRFNQLKFIVPCIFAKFTRVAVKNVNPLETSRVKIWYQAQE